VKVQDPWVFTYGKDTVYKAEFERLLSKNRKDKERPSEQEVREYLELYENFKMKVKEANKMQLDTSSAFKTELAGYRKQLANPYLTDKKVTESLVKEAYNRMKEEVNASHILINCAENAPPKDTLAAYNKVLDLRKRILKGESFDSVASKYSEDPSAKKNYGSLGWFTAFYMIYPFETQAYNTAKGQVSMPFRTRFGYHIVKVNDRRPARGEVKVAHIMIQGNQSNDAMQWEDAKKKIDTVYQKLMSGGSFEELAKTYSQDQSSNQNGGVMSYMSSFSNYPEAFKDICFNTTVGEVSKPFKTDFGWHIIKSLEKKPVPELKEVEESIKTKINRDSRSESNKMVVAQRIKKENTYKEYAANIKEMTAGMDSSFLDGSWMPDYKLMPEKPVISIGSKIWNTHDFAKYLTTVQEPHKGESKEMIVANQLKKFSDEKAMEYEESILDTKYEDFRNLMQEYHDGILLFDLTDKKVWTKAVTDTAGLEKYYEVTKSKYMWKDRLAVYTVTCLNEKAKNEAMKMAAAGKTNEEIAAKLNKKIAGTVSFDLAKYEKGANPQMDKFWDKKGAEDIKNEGGQFKFYIISGIVGPENKTIKEARGVITSDYQSYLEKEWIRELRNTYPVVVNEPVLQTLFN
jgi:peptidyl-prolyl cis-trans isomerase SurA